MSVSDSGRGIAPEVLPRLFQPFEQGTAEVTRSFGGLGLGLSIANALVEMHEGSLVAASEGEGRGAQFLVTLALSAFAVAAEAMTAAAAATMTTTTTASHGRILLVEDNAATAAVLERLLTKEAHEWRAAGNAAEALTLARTVEFDVLICDIGLPDGTGLDVISGMRVLQPACKAIALSGCGTAEDVQRSLDAGAATHLTKPVRRAEISSAIARLLQHG